MLDFLAVGPQKTGTTWLYEMLNDHPKICFPKDVKETMFFDEYYSQGLSRYQSYFSHAEENQLLAEVAPSYFDYPDVPQRVYKQSPRCKVLVSLRNPIERTFSLYCHHLRKGRVPKDFNQATQKMPRILESGHYSRFIPLWLEAFPKKQVHFILMDDIKTQPAQVLKDICNFIDVSVDELPDSADLGRKVNGASMPKSQTIARFATYVAGNLRALQLDQVVETAKSFGLKCIYSGGEADMPQITFEEKTFLSKYYESDVRYIENLLNRSLPAWKPS